MIYGERIRQARELQGITQTELAKRIGINQSAISQIEKDEFIPSPDLLKAITKETGFLLSFLERESVNNFPKGSLNFRAKRALTAREEAKAYQYAKVMYEQVDRMIYHFEVPLCSLPKLYGEQPCKAAQITRSSFGLSPDAPITNLVSIVENNGVIIFTVPLFLPKIDAFSTWAKLDEERPVVIISSGKPMDRLRFSIAHELGHLVIHQTIRNPLKVIENEAHEFAAEFLMPEQAIRNDITLPLTLTNLAKLKVRWGVSMQAIIYRARSLKIITERQAKYLFTQLSAHGWKMREPTNLDVTLEFPHLVRNMIETKYESPEDYALEMGMSLERATEFYIYA